MAPARPLRPTALLLAACVALAACGRDDGSDPAHAGNGDPTAAEALPKPEARAGSVTGMPQPGDPRAARIAADGVTGEGFEGDVEYTASDAGTDTGSLAPAADASSAQAVADAALEAATSEAPGTALPAPPPPEPVEADVDAASQAVVVPLEGDQAPAAPVEPALPEPPPADLPAPPPSDDDPAAG